MPCLLWSGSCVPLTIAGQGKAPPAAKHPSGSAKPRPKASAAPSKSKTKLPKDHSPSFPSAPLPKGKKGPGAVPSITASVKSSVSARSRSTSVMPSSSLATEIKADDLAEEDTTSKGEQEDEEDEDKLYCICKTSYDDEKVMIACDRCDEWYHPTCVNMPDLEVDLVDQFICPLCIQKEPHLNLRTTYKRRCHYGLRHDNPDSVNACHKPARGALSKYCSDECGVKFMRMHIFQWAASSGGREKLWESVKGAEQREGVVMRVPDSAHASEGVPAKPVATKAERALTRLRAQLDDVVMKREELMKRMEVLVWREKVTALAVKRAESVEVCGWDQRLCFGDKDITEFGAGVLESYGEGEGKAIEEEGDTDADADVDTEAMHVDEGQGEWWCEGKKKCERHAGWQKLRVAEVEFAKEMMELALEKLTMREREIRKRVEDIVDPHARAPQTTVTNGDTAAVSPREKKHQTNGIPSSSKPNGEAKKNKKKS
ncbi:hypothetical protein K488DRAFT_48234 [Vararia minispora EC-137]|uniref:Uncharacterized protein n=1 Tax=Vararia minispora EC-137 TaxID=1314806 RepID=A0ACB8QNA3_9AGAM|nr:hypothetical protein K488DRAFT_48234 [Vararia minispora EC-137]